MSGDYTRFTFDPSKRYSGVLMQQGRVQLDSDWNEEIDILRRRLRTTTLDTLGPLGVPYTVSPDAFSIGWIASPPADLSIGPGRLYVDGIQIECFAEDGATYNNQPFYPPQSSGFPPPALPASGDAVVYLDVWQREVTYIEDSDLLDAALGGADTTARWQTVWQLRVDSMPGAACGVAVGEAASAGRLTSRAIVPPAPDDPCILPPASGYRGLENRLYRVEIHEGGALGTARFKWSRDNGSIVSSVRDIAVSGTQTTLTVNRIGRDAFLRFRAGDWVTVTDDHRELTGQSGEMALIVNIDETNRQIVLDRALPGPSARPFGANAAQIAERHTRLQRWDQTGATNTVDADGLIDTAAGPIAIEDGIEIELSADPAGGSFRTGDYWMFWARTATARIEELVNASPRGIRHHFVQIAAITGLGSSAPVITDCRPPPQQQAGDCCCTIIVRPGENIQAGIDALPAQGGCVCLKTGLHVIRESLRIARGNIVLKAESPGTTVQSQGQGPVLIIGNPRSPIEGVDVLGIDFIAASSDRDVNGVVAISAASRVRISHCGMKAKESAKFIGVLATITDRLGVLSSRFASLAGGILVRERCEGFEADGNIIEVAGPRQEPAILGIAYFQSAFACRITRNVISGAIFGILLNDQPFGDADSLADLSFVTDNAVLCPLLPEGTAEMRPAAIDVAADGCRVSGNRIQYESPFYIGIRVAGSRCEITGNSVISRLKERDNFGPLAIQIGGVGREKPKPVLTGIAASNTLAGLQHGIGCMNASSLVIEGNIIDSLTGRLGLGIFGSGIAASEVVANRIIGAASAIIFVNGRQNRIAGNDCRAGGSGISVFAESAPQIAGNRLDQLDLWGIYANMTAARLDIVENRLTKCAGAMPDIAYAIRCFAVFGEAHISANEILDTGSNGGQQALSKADYGIVGDLVLEARVEGNHVSYNYSTVALRDPQREDRALVMRGALEFAQNADAIPFGFAILIQGNKFIGTGRTALIELREAKISDQLMARFERVSFDQNYCWHLSAPVFAPGQAATVWLVGRRASVIGNHVKSQARFFPSVNFNNMPGPYMGNTTAGGTLNHVDFPAPAPNFNVIAN